MPTMVTSSSQWSPEINERIRAYYTRYYRDTLGLPDWENRVRLRGDEESQEEGHFRRAFGSNGPWTGRSFLNVGCGTGGMNIVAKCQGMIPFGIELSEDALEICRLKAKEAALPEDSFVHSVAERIPFPDNHFDFVHCLSVLEHVLDVRKAIQEMVRVTRPGGLIYIHVPNYLAFWETHYKIFWFPKLPKPLAHFYLRLRGRPSNFIDTLNYTTPGMITKYLANQPVAYEQAKWDCSSASPKSIYLKELFYSLAGIAPGDFWVRKNKPEKPRACGFIDFAVSCLVPQPAKYSFLSHHGTEVVAHNAIAGNLDLFSGDGAEDYEEKHLQNKNTIDDLHTNTASTGRLLKNYFMPGSRLLEVGAGTGFWSGHLLAKVEKAVINDLSPDMVNEHRKRRTPEELTKIEAYHCGTVESLTRELAEKGKTFDRIVAISALHHLEHRDAQIPRLWDRLEPGGQLFFIEPCHNFKRILRILRKLATEYRAPYIPSTHDFLTLSEVNRWVRLPAMRDAQSIALGSTQFPLVGRLAKRPNLYFMTDRALQHIPVARGQGNMIFGVIQKTEK